jgi:glycosyltransferase involved in cell wall biosynthesis
LQASTLDIAFYAPLKSPLHPIPSGDRKIARLFMAALQDAGFKVKLASQLRSFDKHGNSHRQQRMVTLAKHEAQRIMRRWRKQNFQPKAWFSYHLYYKAPDLIGPIICLALNIPYLVAEASWAAKRAQGPWSLYHQHIDSALGQAAKIICINPVDKIALTAYYANETINRIESLAAFIDDRPQSNPNITRQQLADAFVLDIEKPWLISIAMMRSGDKFASYQLLSKVIHKLQLPFQLLIVGDGEMRPQVNALFSTQSQVKFANALPNDHILELLTHFEILVWPAINEALGMIFLEAQQAGVAIVAGNQGGVSSIVKDQFSGLLFDALDVVAMTSAITTLLSNPQQLQRLQQQAQIYIAQQHSIGASALQLHRIIHSVCEQP